MQDETWVHHYDPETKPQSEQWKNFKLPPTGDPEGLLQVCRFDAVNGYSVLAFWPTNGDVLSPPLMTGMGSFIWRAEMVGLGCFLTKIWEHSFSRWYVDVLLSIRSF